MRGFRDLIVWKKAHALTLAVYKTTRQFPKEELYGLTSQIRRSSSSIAANIAEGCGRRTNADFARFLQISFSSASEVEYHLILAHDLELLDKNIFEQLSRDVIEIKKMLAGFLRKLRADH
ncbi:MAG: four helix bundle protein [Ignavibacteria bacterium GWA2_55_25]|nr:MAG: four helix bundle protein [Ignavibacteria bacterium GWA2_55_25]